MAAIAWTIPTGKTQSATTTCAVTDTFNSGASDGCDLNGVDAVAVDVQADSGQTITAAGKLLAYLKNPITGLWSRCPALDCQGTTTGARGEAFPGVPLTQSQGFRLGYAPSGFTVSSGSITINLTVSGKQPNGGAVTL